MADGKEQLNPEVKALCEQLNECIAEIAAHHRLDCDEYTADFPQLACELDEATARKAAEVACEQFAAQAERVANLFRAYAALARCKAAPMALRLFAHQNLCGLLGPIVHGCVIGSQAIDQIKAHLRKEGRLP